MTRQIINIGTGPDSYTGDNLRTAFTKVNDNFAQLYVGNVGANTSINVLTANTVSTNGNVNAGNVLVQYQVIASGNISAPIFIGNGRYLTGVTVSANTGNISFSNLTISGSVAGNIVLAPNGTTVLIATTTGIVGNVLAATSTTAANNVGYLGMPQNATGTATLTIADAGQHIYVTSAGQTITIPANSSVAFPIGTVIAFIAGPSATTVSIAITTDTMYLAGTGTTGTRTLAAYGMATAVKVASTTWYINGSGLT